MPTQDPIYRFGPFELRTRTHELLKHGRRLKLRPQPFRLLQALAERSGDVVTREELCRLLWPEGTFVDFEHGLNTSVKELRGALGDSADQPRYIETLPKLGYRIRVSVNFEASPAGATAGRGESIPAKAPTPASLPARGAQHMPGQRAWAIVVSVAVVLLMSFGGYLLWSRFHRPPPPAGVRVILAVLPFENLTGDPSQDYFSDGLTEEMITQLGRIDPEHLGVIARTSVMQYKHAQGPLEQIGRELGAQYVLEGSVRRDANTVRVAAQLIQLKDQTHLWSRQYDRELSHLLALQGEIAQEISDEIELTLDEHKSPPPVKLSSMSPQQVGAYDLYLKGLFYWNKRTIPGFQQAIGYFEQAIAKDPDYAPAYAALANSYSLFTAYSLSPAAQFMPKARATALRALELDPNLPEAHTALALVVQNYDYDWQTADREYRRAIELNPNHATAHHWYAEHLGYRGRFDEAFRESERARQLDPLSLIIAADQGALLYYSRQYDRAIQQLRAVLEMDPSFPRAHLIGRVYVEKGMFTEARANLEDMRRLRGEGDWYWGELAFIGGRTGQQELARRALKKLEDWNRRERVTTASLLLAYQGVGDSDKTLTYMEKAYAEHWNALTLLKVDPAYDPLRSDPRFQDLLRRVGLSP
jgi:TolB-like protein/DNA-binding winged helix-turn-helix (wHTH) protein